MSYFHGMKPGKARNKIAKLYRVNPKTVRYHLDPEYRERSLRNSACSEKYDGYYPLLKAWTRDVYKKDDPRRVLTLKEISEGINEYHGYRPSIETLLKANDCHRQRWGHPYLLDIPDSQPPAYLIVDVPQGNLTTKDWLKVSAERYELATGRRVIWARPDVSRNL